MKLKSNLRYSNYRTSSVIPLLLLPNFVKFKIPPDMEGSILEMWHGLTEFYIGERRPDLLVSGDDLII